MALKKSDLLFGGTPPRPDVILTCPTCGSHDCYRKPGSFTRFAFICRTCKGRW
jgi:hypothetical protein